MSTEVEMTTNDLPYQILGDFAQVVEVTLSPGRGIVAEHGCMLYMEDDIEWSIMLGDNQEQKFRQKLWTGMKRGFAGERWSVAVFTNRGDRERRIQFAAPGPGTILPIDLAQLGGRIISRRGSFLCGMRGTKISVYSPLRNSKTKVALRSMVGGQNLIMQKLTGHQLIFIHVKGRLQELSLAAGEMVRVDNRCIAAVLPCIQHDFEYVGSLRKVFFASEGCFLATLRGPGKIWLQSLPSGQAASTHYYDH